MKIMKSTLKCMVAGITAVVFLCLIFTVYYLQPAHITNEKGDTDYIWIPRSKYMKMTEGIVWGQFDEAGYNNQQVIDNPDILFLGSSHMEATNVLLSENAASLLANRVDNQYTVYNKGVSAHFFVKVCSQLSKHMEGYEEIPKVVVIETATVNFTTEEISELLEGKVEMIPSYDSPMMLALQKVPFFSVLYFQLTGGILDLFMPDNGSNSGAVLEDVEFVVDTDAYDQLFAYLAEQRDTYGTNIIIFYHPMEVIEENGSISFPAEAGLEVFKETCEKYGITFVDMTSCFLQVYEDTYNVPHGFCTGAIGSGHLNRYGHAAIADELYEVIDQQKEAWGLCN